eukprot:5576435-Amphidinium_carterae.1
MLKQGRLASTQEPQAHTAKNNNGSTFSSCGTSDSSNNTFELQDSMSCAAPCDESDRRSRVVLDFLQALLALWTFTAGPSSHAYSLRPERKQASQM